MKKFIFLLFLVCVSFEVAAQDDKEDIVYLDYKPDWFDEYCGSTIAEFNESMVKCLLRLMGVHNIVAWNKEHFLRVYGETTATGIYSYETSNATHARRQLEYINYLVPGYIIQYNDGFGRASRRLPYATLNPGDIVTRADGAEFEFEGEAYDFVNVQATVVAATGNNDVTRVSRVPRGLTDENVKLPFPIYVGGHDFTIWVAHCGFNLTNFLNCEGIVRSSDSYADLGSNYCGEKAKEICLLATFEDPGSRIPILGTSIGTAFVGATIWSVAYLLEHKYSGWSKEMTRLDYTTLSTAIVKSCAQDIGPPGPDPENGLGVLSLECLNDDSEDGFIDNPVSVIKDELYLLPYDGYVKPVLSEFQEATRIEVDLKVLLEGAIP